MFDLRDGIHCTKLFDNCFSPEPEGAGAAPKAAPVVDVNDAPRFSQNDLNKRDAETRRETETRAKVKIEEYEGKLKQLSADLEAHKKTVAQLEALKPLAEENATLKSRLRGHDIDASLLANGCDPKFLEPVRILLEAKKALPEDVASVKDWKPIIEAGKALHPAAFPALKPTGGAPANAAPAGQGKEQNATRADEIRSVFLKTK